MKRISLLLGCMVATILFAFSAEAAGRSLQCQQAGLKFEGKSRSVTVNVGECGTTKCRMTVTVGNKSDDYSVKRSKDSNGSQRYAAKTGTLVVKAISNGIRKATFEGKVKGKTVSAKQLRCTFVD